ncbi:hypothetical protein JCM21900_002965 [Sporobolomyces salmonicolor]
MSFPLVGTAVLFRAACYYRDRQHRGSSPSDSSRATTPRRTSSRQSTKAYSPRLTRTHLAPPKIADALDEPSSSPLPSPTYATPPLFRSPPTRSPSLSASSPEPANYAFPAIVPEPPQSPPSCSESTFPLLSPTASPSASRLAHRTPSIASRRSSTSSSIASIGFHPVASTTLQPVLQSSSNDDSWMAAAAQHERGAGDVGTLERSASLGLGRPPLSLMLPPDLGSATVPATLSMTPCISSGNTGSVATKLSQTGQGIFLSITDDYTINENLDDPSSRAKYRAIIKDCPGYLIALEVFEDTLASFPRDAVLQQFTLWCACNGCPFGLTEDDKLPRLLNEVACRHRPSAIAISVAVNDLSDFCVAEVRSLLDRAYGTIYLAPNGIEVLGVLAFFKTKAGSTELVEHVVPLDFIVLVNTHSGEVLIRVVRELCEEYGLLNKVMGIASDNASNMGGMMDELGEYRLGKDKWVRCWARILNLVVTTIFAYFDSTTGSRFTDPRPESDGEDPSVEDQHLVLNTCVVWFSDDDTAEDAPTEKKCKATEQPGGQTKPAEPKGKDRGARAGGEQGHGEDKEEVDWWPMREETSSDRYTRSLTKWTINKAQKLAEQCCYNCIYPAIKTRWNSRTRQFRQIVSHWVQIEKIQTDPKYNIKKENHLNRGDFRLLSDLLKVLKPFEGLTVAFSTLGGGQIEGVLPMIDLLVRHLEGFLNDPNTIPALHNATISGLEKLFDYYGKTGNYPYYATAILLHPTGGTRYLKCQSWPQVWIDDAIEATQALYNTRHLDKACSARMKAQDRRASSSTTTKSIFKLLDEDDKDNIDLDLDLNNIIRNFATTKRARVKRCRTAHQCP